ncbi:MAG: hypothetical protein EBU81_12655, partial [Proteobacteria bacterium]|nr:hypothetical protein [Pseudomonadota bacterium]
ASNLSQSFAIPILEIDERGHLLTEAVFDLGPARPEPDTSARAAWVKRMIRPCSSILARWHECTRGQSDTRMASPSRTVQSRHSS